MHKWSPHKKHSFTESKLFLKLDNNVMSAKFMFVKK